jgi:hypothetical protein
MQRPFVVLHYTKNYFSKVAYFSKIYYTSKYDPTVSGASVDPTSQIRHVGITGSTKLKRTSLE